MSEVLGEGHSSVLDPSDSVCVSAAVVTVAMTEVCFLFLRDCWDGVPCPHALSNECSLTLTFPLFVSGVRFFLLRECSFVYWFSSKVHRDVYSHLWV